MVPSNALLACLNFKSHGSMANASGADTLANSGPSHPYLLLALVVTSYVLVVILQKLRAARDGSRNRLIASLLFGSDRNT